MVILRNPREIPDAERREMLEKVEEAFRRLVAPLPDSLFRQSPNGLMGGGIRETSVSTFQRAPVRKPLAALFGGGVRDALDPRFRGAGRDERQMSAIIASCRALCLGTPLRRREATEEIWLDLTSAELERIFPGKSRTDSNLRRWLKNTLGADARHLSGRGWQIRARALRDGLDCLQ